MYEILKSQFQSGKSFTQSKHYNVVKQSDCPKYFWDLYPLSHDYYHEFNPFFLGKMYRPELFKFAPVLTVRDGYLGFTSFVLNHFTDFDSLDTGALLIHPSLAPIVPPHMAEKFACWRIVQKKQTSIAKASKVIVFGFANEQYLGNLEDIKEKVQSLKEVNEKAEVMIYLPLRKNAFEDSPRESVTIHELMILIKDIFPGKKLKILTTAQFLDMTDFKNAYFFDLAFDHMYVTDNYLHYFVQSRGGSVNNGSLKAPPKDSIFDLDLSLCHTLHVTPLTQTTSFFPELISYKKQTFQSRGPVYDPSLQVSLREFLRKTRSDR